MATKRKMRRFEVGGYTNETEDSEALADENYGDGTTREQRLAMVRSPRAKQSSDLTEDDTSDYGPRYGRGAAGSSETATAPAAKKAPVVTKEELAKSGLSLRDYMNKQQGLTRRGESVKAAPTGGSGRGGQGGPTAEQNASRYKSDTAGAGRGGQGGPTADELESYARAKKKPDIKGLMPSGEDIQKGLEIAAGGPGIKAVASAAKNLANRAPAAAEKLREYIQPVLSGPTKRLAGPGAKEAVTDVAPKALSGPTRALPAPAKAAPAKETSAARSARRDAEGYSPDEALKALKKTNKKPKKSLDESDTSGGAIGYKKGGNVKGWGIARGARKAKIV